MDRKPRRTVISITDNQPTFQFEASRAAEPPFTLPEYQRGLLVHRTVAAIVDIALVGVAFTLFLIVTLNLAPVTVELNRRTLGVFALAFVGLLIMYFSLFMLGMSQTPGMRLRKIRVVNVEDQPLEPTDAFIRSFGYLVSIAPAFLGLLWAYVDPEHTTWADKVSGTFVRSTEPHAVHAESVGPSTTVEP
jgi:uncharacterized RDD family membrane protein YckC